MAWGAWIGTIIGGAVGAGAGGAIEAYTHRSSSLPADVEAGRAVALLGLGDFTPETLRGWLVSSAALRAELTGGLTQSGDELRAYLPEARAVGWQGDAAALFGRTSEILADLTAEPGDEVPAEPETSGGEVGAWPVAVIAVIVVGAAAAVGWCGYQAAQVIDRALARSAAARELVRTDELAQRLVDGHLARERAAGRSLDLDAATREALLALRERQRAAAPHAPPLDVPSLLGGGAAGGFAFSALPLAAAVVIGAVILLPLLQGNQP